MNQMLSAIIIWQFGIIAGYSQNVGIGMTNPNGRLQFANEEWRRQIVLMKTNNNDHNYAGFGVNGGTLRYQTDALGADHVFFAGSGFSTSNELFRIRGNGNATLAGTLTQNSDATLKKNIEQINDAGALLAQLHGYRYQWKDENADTDQQLGLLAQEVQKVLPELVKESHDGKLGVNYSGLIPVLLEALKEQQQKALSCEKQMQWLLEKAAEQERRLIELEKQLMNN